MKIKIILFFSLCLFISCTHKSIYYEALLPQDTAWIEFNIEEFERLKNGSTYYEYELEDKTMIFDNYLSNTYIRYVKPNNSLLGRKYTYYSNGKLHTVNFYYRNGGFYTGIGYDYDKKGKLIKTQNYDEPFVFTLENVYDFMREKGFSIDKNEYKIYRTTEGFEDFKERMILWEIEISGNIRYTYILDGITGELLYEDSYPVPE